MTGAIVLIVALAASASDELAAGARLLLAGRAREALALAERQLAEPLAAGERGQALDLAAAAATVLDEPSTARYYRLARTADPGVPLALLRDLADERYAVVAKMAARLLADPQPPDRERSLRRVRLEALLSLGDLPAAVDTARGLPPAAERAEMLLSLARRLLDTGRTEAAYDAALAARAPLAGPADLDDEPGFDRDGFEDERAYILARAAAVLGESGQAAGATALLLASPDVGRRATGRRLLIAAAGDAADDRARRTLAQGLVESGPAGAAAAEQALAVEGALASCTLLAEVESLGVATGSEP